MTVTHEQQVNNIIFQIENSIENITAYYKHDLQEAKERQIESIKKIKNALYPLRYEINRRTKELNKQLVKAEINLQLLEIMRRRSEGEHRVRFLSSQEEEKLKEILKQAVSQDIQDAVLMLLYTGFRCGELWRLECRDIDLEHNTLTAWKTKNKHPRTIPIVDTILPIIKRRMRAIEGHGLLFPKGNNAWLRRPWAVIRYHMGMDKDEQFVPHMLRHTCATRLSQAGVTMPIIKEWMGHTTITTTARYAHFNPKDLHNAAKLLGNK